MIDEHLKGADVELSESEAKNDAAFEKAGLIYDKQVRSLQAIRRSSGFAEIVRWHRIEKEACESYFKSDKEKTRLEEVCGKYQAVCRFLTYLENMFTLSEKQALDSWLLEQEHELVGSAKSELPSLAQA